MLERMYLALWYAHMLQTVWRGPLDHACDAAERAELEVVFGCPNDTTNPCADARGESLRHFKAVICTSGERGVRLLNVFAGMLCMPDVPYYRFEQHGSALFTDDQCRWTVDYFRAAADRAGEFGIDLCIETHNAYPHDLPGPTATLIKDIDRPNAKVNFDYTNIYLHPKGGPMNETLDALVPHLGYMHLKDAIFFASFGLSLYRGTSLRDGDGNHEDFIRRLLGAEYRGPWTLENVCPGDKRHAMIEDHKYLRELLARF